MSLPLDNVGVGEVPHDGPLLPKVPGVDVVALNQDFRCAGTNRQGAVVQVGGNLAFMNAVKGSLFRAPPTISRMAMGVRPIVLLFARTLGRGEQRARSRCTF